MNLILLDRDGDLLEYVLNSRKDNIVALVCEKHPKINNLIAQFHDRILHIIDYNQLLEIQNVEYIDYRIIAKLKFAQIDIETMMHRIMFNNPLAKDIYHQHLSFFIGIFKNVSIDLLISSEANLCSPNHHIPLALCYILGIPCYTLNAYHDYAIALANYNSHNIKDQRHIPYIHGTKNFKPEDIAYYKLQTSLERKNINLKIQIRKHIENFIGEVYTQFFGCLAKKNFNQERLGIPYLYWKKVFYYFKYKKLKKFYKKNSIIPSFDTKYIYYNIHLEPEAAIIGKTLLESQLTIIKMLAKALPEGWKLYVKEHPHQFMLNNETAHYFINNLDFFKNIEFYKEIMKIDNTVLISMDVPSKTLMENSQAVATFGGTVTLESAINGTPAILFSSSENLYGILDNTIHIFSYNDLVEAIEKIQENSRKFKKINLDKITPYLADPRDKDFYHNLFTTIEKHAKTIHPTGEKLW